VRVIGEVYTRIAAYTAGKADKTAPESKIPIVRCCNIAEEFFSAPSLRARFMDAWSLLPREVRLQWQKKPGTPKYASIPGAALCLATIDSGDQAQQLRAALTEAGVSVGAGWLLRKPVRATKPKTQPSKKRKESGEKAHEPKTKKARVHSREHKPRQSKTNAFINMRPEVMEEVLKRVKASQTEEEKKKDAELEKLKHNMKKMRAKQKQMEEKQQAQGSTLARMEDRQLVGFGQMDVGFASINQAISELTRRSGSAPQGFQEVRPQPTQPQQQQQQSSQPGRGGASSSSSSSAAPAQPLALSRLGSMPRVLPGLGIVLPGMSLSQ
jgi:hypothetical protein